MRILRGLVLFLGGFLFFVSPSYADPLPPAPSPPPWSIQNHWITEVGAGLSVPLQDLNDALVGRPITTASNYNVSGRILYGLMPRLAVGIDIDNYSLPAFVQDSHIGNTSAVAVLAMMQLYFGRFAGGWTPYLAMGMGANLNSANCFAPWSCSSVSSSTSSLVAVGTDVFLNESWGASIETGYLGNAGTATFTNASTGTSESGALNQNLFFVLVGIVLKT